VAGSAVSLNPMVRLERRGEIAVVTIDNPPVNALSHPVRAGLLEILASVEADPAVEAILLVCSGSTFSAGADVRELGAPSKDPVMAVVMKALDASGKLTVAAIHGQALGGGLETALVFDYRCAAAAAKVGLPEIKLGLIPGGGGTQRLPRLIGVAAAAALILSGDAIGAAKARELGIIDELIDGDLLAGALAYTRRLLSQGAARRRLSAGTVAAPEGFSFAERRAKALEDAKGLPAAAAAVDALWASTDRGFDEGLSEERRLFFMVRDSIEARALRHLFAAERAAAKMPGLSDDERPREIAAVAVVGAGTMGSGIAISFANAGIRVGLIDATEAALARGRGTIEAYYTGQVERGRLKAAERDARLSHISSSLEIGDVGAADLVLECVFEDMGVKQDLLARIGRLAKPGAVLATNTSALDVERLAGASGRPADFVGMHFFSPAQVMKLVEVVRGAATADAVLATAMAVCKRMGKIGVVSGVCDGFIGNRMLRGYRREAELLVLEGASPGQVDKALTGFGMAMGPHAMGDMAGLDISAAGRRRQRAEGVLTDPRVGAVQDKLVETGRLGLKTGKGIYRYEPGSRAPLPDPLVDELIAAEAARLGIERRAVADREIIDRCLLALVNEGARIVAEGIALGPADIDVVYCNGYGFPRRRGGPMFWADGVGLEQVLSTLRRFETHLGARDWTPAPLLVSLAESGRKFADLPRGASFVQGPG
jgi:3-hydroxyacyl-CoA dehydrogenase